MKTFFGVSGLMLGAMGAEIENHPQETTDTNCAGVYANGDNTWQGCDPLAMGETNYFANKVVLEAAGKQCAYKKGSHIATVDTTMRITIGLEDDTITDIRNVRTVGVYVSGSEKADSGSTTGCQHYYLNPVTGDPLETDPTSGYGPYASLGSKCGGIANTEPEVDLVVDATLVCDSTSQTSFTVDICVSWEDRLPILPDFVTNRFCNSLAEARPFKKNNEDWTPCGCASFVIDLLHTYPPLDYSYDDKSYDYKDSSYKSTGKYVSKDSYGKDSYGKDSYGKDIYGKDSYGKDSYGKDSYGKDIYGKDSYGKDSYGKDSYGKDSYGKDSYGKDSYGKDSYGKDSYGKDSYGKDSYGKDSYGKDSHGKDSYGKKEQDYGYETKWYLDNGYDEPKYTDTWYTEKGYQAPKKGNGYSNTWYGDKGYAPPQYDHDWYSDKGYGAPDYSKYTKKDTGYEELKY